MLPFRDEIYRGSTHGTGCMCDDCLDEVDARIEMERAR